MPDTATHLPDYSGKVVMITGAASGFGALAASEFARAGARLSLSDVQKEKLDTVAHQLQGRGAEVVHQVADVSKEADIRLQVEAALERFGALHVGINNAGIGHPMARLPEVSLEDFNRNMAVNAGGAFLGMKYQIPPMVAGGGGAILNVASAAGVMGAGMISAYAASKHAVVGLTRSAADEFASRNVRINALCPSFSDTPMVQEMASAMGGQNDQTYARISHRVPMKRVSRPEEVVQAMLWICSDANSFMTGQAVSIDGGLSAI